MADESKIIKVGTAPKVVPDDMNRDIQMVRNPRITHKIPEIIERTGKFIFAGHLLYILDTASFIASIALNHTDTSTGRSGYTVVVNTDLSAKIPFGIDIARIGGLLFYGEVRGNIHSGKQKAGCEIKAAIYFSDEYDTTPDVNVPVIMYQHIMEADPGINKEFHSGAQCLAPVFLIGSKPYVTWRWWYEMTGMDSGNDSYDIRFYAYLQGLFLK